MDSEESSGDFLKRVGTNGELWAKEFQSRAYDMWAKGENPFDADPGGFLHVWFVSAIETGRAAGYFQGVKDSEKYAKKSITYEDLEGNTLTENFYFHLSKAELIELEVSAKEGLTEMFKKIIETRDGAQIIAQFKKIILLAYGVKGPDGKAFIKSEELRTWFSQTEAYSVLFMELATDAGAAAKFIQGIVPAGLVKDSDVAVIEQNPEEKKDRIEVSAEEYAAFLKTKQQ